MRRLIALLAVFGLFAGGAVIYQRIERNRAYRSLLAAGDEALAAGDTYSAIEALSGAIALRPDSMVAFYRRGEAYQRQRRDDEAVRDLVEASRLAPDATQPLVALGRLYDAQGHPALAADWYGRAASRLHGEDASLLYALGLARYRAGAPAAAREPLERAVARPDSAPEAHYLLGLVYRDLNSVKEAVASLENAVRLDRTLTAAREELADLYHAVGRATADELAQLEALALVDQQPDRRVAVALAQARHAQFDAALATLEEAARTAPDDSRVHLARARVHLARAERSGARRADTRAAALARQAAEQALGGTARRSEAFALYGRALFLTNDPAAVPILRQAVTTSPVDLEAFGFLADAAERHGHPLEAREALISLDALQGDTVTAAERATRARRIGDLSLRAGDPRGAAEYLARAVDGGHDDIGVLAQLAEAYWRAGDAPHAKETLARALNREPRNTTLLRLQRTLIK